MKNRSHRGENGGTGDTIKTIGLATLIAAVLASSVALVAAARTLDLGPRIGDIFVFRTGMQLPADWGFTVVNQSTEAPRSCELRPQAMASGGGSLVVEQRYDSQREYRVHWAGARTSSDANDCGSAADLLIQRTDLQLLSNAVGGPGVERNRFLWF